MRIVDKLDILSELAAIKIWYGLTYEDLSKEMWDYVGVSGVQFHRLLIAGEAKRAVLTSMEQWLRKVGRKKYPLGKGIRDGA